MRLLKLFLLLSVVPTLMFAQRGGGHGGGGGGAHGGGGFSGGGVRGGGSAAVSRGGYGAVGGYRGGYYGGYRGGYYGGYYGRGYGYGYYGRYYGGPYYGAYWGWPFYWGYGWPAYSYYPSYGGCDPYYGCYYGTTGYTGSYAPDPGSGYVSAGYGSAPATPPVVINQNIGSAQASDAFYRTPDYYLIAFNDHTIRAAASYRIDGSQIYWTSREGEQMQAPLSSVDRRFSEQINRDRRVAFPLQ